MTPSAAFSKLKATGAFVEVVDGYHIQWYWHDLSNGFKCLASRNLDGNCAPTIYHAFHFDDKPIRPKQYFLR